MRIEDAIKQNKPFQNAYESLSVNILYTNNWLRDNLKSQLKPFDVTIQQYNVLRILRGAGKPITTSVIRERLIDKMADTSRLVERMGTKGWVERKTCSTDKRLVDVFLTDEGLTLVNKLDKIAEDINDLFSSLSEKEAAILGDLLDKLRNDS